MIRSRLFAGLLLGFVLVLAGCAGSSMQQSSGMDDGPANILYVANQGDAKVTLIDMDTNEIVDVVDLREFGYSDNAKPHHIAVEPDGSFWYVSMIGENRVLKFNRANEVVGMADFEVPGLLALDPHSDMLYVGRSMSAVNPPKSIGRIDRTDMSVEEVIDVFYPRPHALALSADGDIVYSASLAENRMARIDPDEEDVELMDVPGPLHTLVQFAVSPDGRWMVGGGEISAKFLIYDLSDPAAPQHVATLDVNGAPWHPIFSPDSRYVYFANKMANSVTIVDVPNKTVAAVIEGEGLAQPHGSALSPDGRYLYISNNNLKGDHMAHMSDTSGDHEQMVGSVVVIDTATREIVKAIPVGYNLTGVGSRGVQ